MKPILEYIISKSSKVKLIYATDKTIHQIVRNELKKSGPNVDLNYINTSNVTDMYGLFSVACHIELPTKNLTIFNGDITGWDVSNVKTMERMFEGCHEFNKDISCWDVSNVNNMFHMFFNCEKFNQPLHKWKVDNVNNFTSMFEDAKSFNQDLRNWNINQNSVDSYMFKGSAIKLEYMPKRSR